MTMKKVLEMKAKREDARLKAMAVLNKAEAEDRFLSDEEQKEIDKYESEIRAWDESITRAEKVLAIDPEDRAATEHPEVKPTPDKTEEKRFTSFGEQLLAAYRAAAPGGTSITDTFLDSGNNEKPRIKVDLTDAFTEAGIEYNTELTKAYEATVDSKFDADLRSGGSTGANVVESLKNPGADFYTAELMNKAKAYSDTAVAVLSRWGAENGGQNELKSIGTFADGTFLELTAEEKIMFDKLQENGFNVIVLLNVCNNMELGFVKDYSCIKACLHIGIPGQSGTAAIPKILNGTVNPSGKMSDILPYDYQTNDPVYVNAVKNNNDLVYQEGIYFGYKWYETADAEGVFDGVSNKYGEGYDGVVQYPFGHGLSYTTFSWEAEWSGLTSLSPNGEYTVKVKVTNTGNEDGKDVVQLYGHAPYKAGGIEKAERVLLDFAKTPLIKAGGSETVELKFSTYDMASYDDYDKNGNGHRGYELDSGSYRFSVMKNSHDEISGKDIQLSENIKYTEDPETGKTVGNLFTADKAYANCPIDGSTALNTPVNYLSRNNKFANIPTASAGTSKSSVVNNAANYRYTGYDNKDVSNIEYELDAGMYLVLADFGEEKRQATIEQLEGKDSSVALVFDTEILEYLAEYDNDEIWDIVLNQMTRSEVLDLIGLGGFQTVAVESIGKPRCQDKDGPAGFNNNVASPGKSCEYTLFPSESLLGCIFDKQTAYDLGVAQAKIGSAEGININGWYGPGVNLHRSVYNSRNYEYYGEDAVLSGKLAAETIKGAKEHNLYCYLKHFAVSEAGQNPKAVNTWLTEQALRESYLKPFEIAVKDGGANAMMSAFNRVGATLAGYNHAMLTDVLREEWGFRGSVITDWYTGGENYMTSHELGVLAGNDLWLCGSIKQSANLNLDNTAQKYAARQSVKNILYTYVDTYLTASSVGVTAAPQSALLTALWAVADVVLVIGIGVCVTFAVLPLFRKKKSEANEEV